MGFDDDFAEGTMDGLRPSDFSPDDLTMQGAASMAACPVDVVLQPYSPTTVYHSSKKMDNALAVAASKLKSHKMQALLQHPSTDAEMEPSLHLVYDATGRAVGATVTMVPCPETRATLAAATNVKAGDAMPYIRLPEGQRLTVAATAQLHLLSDEQEFAFRLIMDTMERHLRKEENIPQLTMSILGSAGEQMID